MSLDGRKREQNEAKYESWEDLAEGGRRYSLTVPGRSGWKAIYLKKVDSDEKTIRFWQEIYDETGTLVEEHQKYPQDRSSEDSELTMPITRKEVADKLVSYFDSRLSLAELVDWAEDAIQEGDFAEEKDSHVLRDVVARIGLADVKAFGLEWGDHKEMLSQLGYKASVVVQPQP